MDTLKEERWARDKDSFEARCRELNVECVVTVADNKAEKQSNDILLRNLEVKTLFGILRRLKSQSVGMIYILHKLGEVFEMSDRITVLRDGRTIGTNNIKDLTVESVVARMVGREVGDIFPKV